MDNYTEIMKTLTTSQLYEHLNEIVGIQGWVHSYRKMGGIAFLVIRDGFGTIQVVIEKPDLLSICESLTRESIVSISGKLIEQKAVSQGIELQAESIEVKVLSEPPPIEIDRQKTFNKIDFDVIFNNRAISLRNLKTRAIFKVQSKICSSFRSFLDNNGFTEIHTPKIVKMGAEGGSEVFKLDYFDQEVYLAQSPQLYKQMMVGVFQNVYEIGNVYRAEVHNTNRHLNEYVGLDVEMGFVESLDDLMTFHQDLMDSIFDTFKTEELESLNIEFPKVYFCEYELQEVISIVKENYNYECTKEDDLDSETERLICKYAEEKCGQKSPMVYVTKYPVTKRPFYTMPSSDGIYTMSFDVLFGGLEIATGGLRINDYNQLRDNIIKFGYKVEDFEDYLASFKHGMPPHGGFGMGLERLTKQMFKLDNIRHASLFPRDRTRIRP